MVAMSAKTWALQMLSLKAVLLEDKRVGSKAPKREFAMVVLLGKM